MAGPGTPAPAVEVRIAVRYRDHWNVDLRIGTQRGRIGVPDSAGTPVHIMLADREFTVAPGTTRRLALPGT
ncbi:MULTISPECIES: hypothetical protein [unclassified Streptomyces]|uniref:hypothetical protein n=1 Tax=unclassified Streptomyces TaxID=2593676 RepID=UPI00382BBDAC